MFRSIPTIPQQNAEVDVLVLVLLRTGAKMVRMGTVVHAGNILASASNAAAVLDKSVRLQ